MPYAMNGRTKCIHRLVMWCSYVLLLGSTFGISTVTFVYELSLLMDSEGFSCTGGLLTIA